MLLEDPELKEGSSSDEVGYRGRNERTPVEDFQTSTVNSHNFFIDAIESEKEGIQTR